jgi:hypothetical protein
MKNGPCLRFSGRFRARHSPSGERDNLARIMSLMSPSGLCNSLHPNPVAHATCKEMQPSGLRSALRVEIRIPGLDPAGPFSDKTKTISDLSLSHWAPWARRSFMVPFVALRAVQRCVLCSVACSAALRAVQRCAPCSVARRAALRAVQRCAPPTHWFASLSPEQHCVGALTEAGRCSVGG